MRFFLLLLVTAASLAASSRRIISTAPSITETLFAMGLGPRVVGVTSYCSFPKQVLSLPKIGTWLTPDIEAIVALHPDLVIVQKLPNHLSEQLSQLHIRHIEVQNENLSAVYNSARAIGNAVDDPAASELFVHDIETKLRRIRNQTATLRKPSVVFLVGHTPGRLEGLFAGAGGSYFSDLLATAGATNVFADSTAPYPKITVEEILSRNPDYVLDMSADSPLAQNEVRQLWQSRASMRAVAQHHVYAVPAQPFVVPGPRVTEAVDMLVRLLHPELSH